MTRHKEDQTDYMYEYFIKRNEERKPSLGNRIPKRYIVTFLTLLGTTVIYILRTNLSIAIIEMSSEKQINTGKETYTKRAEFNWTSWEVGLLLSSFSWGYTFSFIGGISASKFGGVKIFGLGIAGTAFLTLFTPLLIRFHLFAYLGARVLEGVFEGLTASSLSEIFIHWAPAAEKTRLLAVAHSGIYIGAAVNHPLSGFVANVFGWEGIFYVTGGISLLWYLLWFCFVSNIPAEDKFISDAEKLFLKDSIIYETKEKLVYPWKKILTSKPVWAFLNDRFVAAWSMSFMVYYLPLYIKDVHNTNVANIGLVTTIPSLCSFFGLIGASIVADHLRSNGILSIQSVHKLFISLSQVFAAIMLISAGQWKSYEGSIICFCLCRLCFSLADSSYDVLPLDLCPRYASVITGIAFGFMNIGYMLNPLIITHMVPDHNSSQWSQYFIFLGTFNIWGGIVFLLYGSGKVQSWAIIPTPKSEDSNNAGEMDCMTSKCSNS